MTAARSRRGTQPGTRGALPRDRAIVIVTALMLTMLLAPVLPGTTPESEPYFDVARSVLEGHGLRHQVVDFWRATLPDPLGRWPPLYPLLVAAIARLGVPLERAARLVSQLAFPAFAVLFHALALSLLPAAGALVVTVLACGTLAVAFASGTAWSEMLYLALSTGALLALVRRVEHGGMPERGARMARAAALAGTIAGLAALTRTIGIVLVPIGVVALTFGRVRTRVLAAWALPAVLLPGLWMARGLVRFGSPFGPGTPHAHSTMAAIAAQFAPAARWGFVPWPLEAWAPASALVLVLLVSLTLFALVLGGTRALLAAYVALDLVVLFIARASRSHGAVGFRDLMPVGPFVWLAAAVSLGWFAERVRFAATLARGAAIVLLALTAVTTCRFVVRMPRPSPEAAQRARESEALRLLLAGSAGPVLSDAGDRVRSATGRAAVQVPERASALRAFTADDEARWRAAGVRVAVFRQDHVALRPDGSGGDAAAGIEDRFGPYLASRLTPTPSGAWPVIARGGGFVLYRIR